MDQFDAIDMGPSGNEAAWNGGVPYRVSSYVPVAGSTTEPTGPEPFALDKHRRRGAASLTRI